MEKDIYSSSELNWLIEYPTPAESIDESIIQRIKGKGVNAKFVD